MSQNVLQKVNVPVGQRLDAELVSQITYMIKFINEKVESIEQVDKGLVIHYKGDDTNKLLTQIYSVLDRVVKKRSNTIKKSIVFTRDIQVPEHRNIMDELLNKRIVKKAGDGVYTFHEPFSLIMEFLDYLIVQFIAIPLNARKEIYPAIIPIKTLNKTNYFSSFAQNIHFLTHLQEDLDAISSFAQQVEANHGLKEKQIEEAPFSHAKYVNNPAVCYHCYESLGHTALKENQIITACGKCNRYEGNNHDEFGRLLDFTMREVIFVGDDEFIKQKRQESIDLLEDMVDFWGINCQFENANDPFFTDDNRVKATLQRAYEMKYELKMRIPFGKHKLAVCSSNYHGDVLGKSFYIQTGGQFASTGCLAFGLERWTLGFLAQYGIDKSKWPKSFLRGFLQWEANGSMDADFTLSADSH
ncbi:hypothetical protein ACFVRA_09600 [Bacillus subtilis]|uniref:hypothetical protein n=1 Tax=Bacillus subtilis TaxID=1423 RepID=UPI0022E4E9B1|nr:hypothetical protein [Bacillus subtilis]